MTGESGEQDVSGLLDYMVSPSDQEVKIAKLMKPVDQ